MPGKKLLVWTLVGLTAGLAVLAAGVWLAADPVRIEAELVRRLEAASGRRVRFEAPPVVHLGLQPRLALTGLSVTDRLEAPAAAGAPALLRVEHLEARLDPAALLAGEIYLPSVRLKGVRVDLTVLDRPGPRPSPTPVPAAEGAAADGLAAGSSEPAPGLRVASFSAEDLNVRYGTDAAAQDGLHLVALQVEVGPDGQLRLDVRGELSGEAVTIAGVVDVTGAGPWLQRAVVGRLAGTLREGRLELEGQVGSLLPLAGATLDAALTLGSGPLAGLTVQARLAGDLELLHASDIRATAGATALTGALDIEALVSPLRVRGALQAESLHIGLGGGAPADPLVLPPPLPIDLEVDLAIQRVTGIQPVLESLSARLHLREDHLALTDLKARAANGHLTGALELAGRGPALQVSGQLDATGLQLGRLPLPTALQGQLSGALDTRLALQASGPSTLAWGRSGAGTVRAMLRDGRIRARSAEQLVGGITTLFDTLTADRSEWLQLNCAAADFVVSKGVARSRLLVLDSEHASVVGEGSVNLGTEQLAFLVSPRPKTVTLNLSVPVRVSGHWGAPVFTVDEAAAARRIGGLLAGALVFPPAVIAAFADLGYANSGCVGGAVLQHADGGKALLEQTTDAVGRTADEVVSGAGEAAASAGDLAIKAGKATGDAATKLGEGLGNAAKKAADTVGTTFGKLFGN